MQRLLSRYIEMLVHCTFFLASMLPLLNKSLAHYRYFHVSIIFSHFCLPADLHKDEMTIKMDLNSLHDSLKLQQISLNLLPKPQWKKELKLQAGENGQSLQALRSLPYSTACLSLQQPCSEWSGIMPLRNGVS